MAVVINGQKISKKVREDLKEHVTALAEWDVFKPGLAIVQVGDRPDSNTYIRMKIKAASEIGIRTQHIKLGNQSTQQEVISALECLNNNPEIHGVILQLPLDTCCTVDEDVCTNTILTSKDVDG
ncbi:C-1-tetrahydrofolate synthase, cytoplasmic-like [Bolinopsis microptera]|uniref:C-1-tetrahydrofolate synthase, cytoplasmic-like n=1 Tax=Bolinopsis microptera TaxID=2820187 RepID=UPI00307AB2F9